MDLWQWHCRNKRERKIVAIGLWQCHCQNKGGICDNCDNTIAKNGRKKNSGCRNLGMN